MRFDQNQPAEQRQGTTHRSTTRSVMYIIEWTTDVSEYAARDVLTKHPDVRNWGSDTGFIWFEGNPGPDMRAAKREVLRLTGGVSVPTKEPR